MRQYASRSEKKERVYNYLVELVNNGKSLPCLSKLSEKITDMHMTTLMDVLKTLDKEKKIIYKKGKILAVSVPDVRGVRERSFKFNNEKPIVEEPVVEEPTLFEDYANISKEEGEDMFTLDYFDKAVKMTISDFILNANINTSEEIIEYVNTITKIADRIRKNLHE